jgi:MraZ protein
MARYGIERHKMAAKGKQPIKQISDQSAPVEEPSSFSFRGSFEHNLDDNGRISVPANFRQALTETNLRKVVLTNFVCDGVRCLEGFALSSWEKFEQKLAERSRFDPQLKKLENFYLARAAECQIDSSGRICVPQHLRLYAGLEKEVVFTSSIHGFRMWAKRVWEHVFQEAEAALMEDPSLFLDVDK